MHAPWRSASNMAREQRCSVVDKVRSSSNGLCGEKTISPVRFIQFLRCVRVSLSPLPHVYKSHSVLEAPSPGPDPALLLPSGAAGKHLLGWGGLKLYQPESLSCSSSLNKLGTFPCQLYAGRCHSCWLRRSLRPYLTLTAG